MRSYFYYNFECVSFINYTGYVYNEKLALQNFWRYIMKKINAAVIISVSEYENISRLPGCKNDFRLISDLIRATDKYDEILEIYEFTTSAKVKEKLTNFFMKIQEYNVDELFFYYTGHGAFDGEDLKFALTDYSSEKFNATTLSNDFIDQQIRSINPKLTVKVVDACNSGVPYIKGDADLNQVFEEKKNINNCYFMFSSHSNQYSYVDKLSYFTRSFVESVLNYEGKEISYTSIIDYIKDNFIHSERQTPFFVTQGTMTDMFCVITDLIKHIDISKYMNSEENDSKATTDLINLVKERSELYFTKEQIEDILIKIKSELSKLETLNNFSDLFNLEIQEVKNYSNVSGIKAVAKWVDENQNDYFIKVKKEKVAIQKDQGGLFTSLQVYSNLLNPVRYEAVDIFTELDIIFDTLKLKATPKFPAVLPYQCDIVFLLSKHDMAVFYRFISFIETGWEIYDFGKASNWNNFNISYEEIKDDLSEFTKITQEFTAYIECDLRKRLDVK
ncbi:caspase family protein [Clostridium botulinum]